MAAAPSKPGKSFTVEVKAPGEIRIVRSPEPRQLGHVYEPDDPNLDAPRLGSQVEPKYTREAMAAKIQGDVELTAVVMPDGTVANVRVVKSLDPCRGLDEQAVIAARQWRFVPARMSGQPVPVKVTLILSFRLH
ncbi:MAG TPA: energy transducer TonB [Vicinamibacterales bacterium]|nr:energy transducer TonB [Vicinamibacterales bacterium]